MKWQKINENEIKGLSTKISREEFDEVLNKFTNICHMKDYSPVDKMLAMQINYCVFEKAKLNGMVQVKRSDRKVKSLIRKAKREMKKC